MVTNSRNTSCALVWAWLLLLLVPLMGRAQTPVNPPATQNAKPVQVAPVPTIPDVAEWLPESIKARFTPQAKLQREISALAGVPQSITDWMMPGARYDLLSPSNPDGTPGGTKTKIVNVNHLLANNSISYYRFPWQAWQETVPASRLSDGLGINLNLPDSQLPAAIKQLKAMGVTKWRMDIGWGNVDSRTMKLGAGFQKNIVTRIALCKQAGIRPLFCLDTNPAAPCPINEASVELLEASKVGDTSVLLKPRPGEVPTAWKSGLSHVTAYWAAEFLATAVEKEGEGYRVTFAKPLPIAYEAGTTLSYAYLAYRPFGNDASPERERTFQGFLSFVQATQDYLETQKLRKSASDPGYDIEFLNENSNGQFFHLVWYAPGMPDGSGCEMELYKRVVKQLRSNPANEGMTLINGYYNQLPPAPGAQDIAGSNGGSSHFYQGAITEKAHRGPVEDAFGRDTPDGFIPNVTLRSPEIIFSAVKLEHLSRELYPYPVDYWGGVYGRGIQPRSGKGLVTDPVALEPNGKLARATHWYKTEWGDAIWQGTPEEKYRLRAKYVLRGTVFALSKGLERIYWYAAADASLGLLTEDANKLPAEEPLTVTTMKRLDALMAGGKITKARQMPCVLISEKHGHIQFKGDGTVSFPDLANRDILFVQSFQLSDTDLMAAVYVPTLNFEPDLPEETYTIRWSGVKWTNMSKATYRDVLNDRQAKTVKPSAVGADWVEFTLPVTDVPRFLKLTGV